MKMMKWYGITGGIASGKSTVSQKLRKLGFKVVDADQLARDVVAPGTAGLQSVVQRFGVEVLNSNGDLNRKALGAKVFDQTQELLALENILHPLIKQETARLRAELEKAGETVAFYDVPLLFEKKMESQFDGIIVVTSPEADQIRRMKIRDGLSDEEIHKRLSTQISLAEKEKKAHFLIRNSGSLEDLDQQIEHLLKKLQSG